MLSSMTLAEIQAKYSGIHTPEEIEQFHQNMTTSKKWKIVKNEWTWDGLNHVQLRGRALQYHPSLDMVELYKEHPYKTALRLVYKEEHLEDSGDEESVADSDLEEDDDDEADYDNQIKEAAKQYNELKKRMAGPSDAPAPKKSKKAVAVDADGNPVAKKPVGRPNEKGSIWDQFINMNRTKGPQMTPMKYVTYCQNTVDDDGNKRDPTKPVMFKKISNLAPYWMQIEYSSVNNSMSWQPLPEDHGLTKDEGEGELWY